MSEGFIEKFAIHYATRRVDSGRYGDAPTLLWVPMHEIIHDTLEDAKAFMTHVAMLPGVIAVQIVPRAVAVEKSNA